MYVRVVSEKLQLDHIVDTDSTEKILTWEDIQRLLKTDIFEKIIIYVGEKSNSLYLRSKNADAVDTITYIQDQWINLSEVKLVDESKAG